MGTGYRLAKQVLSRRDIFGIKALDDASYLISDNRFAHRVGREATRWFDYQVD
jgi:hypothetical protein